MVVAQLYNYLGESEEDVGRADSVQSLLATVSIRDVVHHHHAVLHRLLGG